MLELGSNRGLLTLVGHAQSLGVKIICLGTTDTYLKEVLAVVAWLFPPPVSLKYANSAITWVYLWKDRQSWSPPSQTQGGLAHPWKVVSTLSLTCLVIGLEVFALSVSSRCQQAEGKPWTIGVTHIANHQNSPKLSNCLQSHCCVGHLTLLSYPACEVSECGMLRFLLLKVVWDINCA